MQMRLIVVINFLSPHSEYAQTVITYLSLFSETSELISEIGSKAYFTYRKFSKFSMSSESLIHI